ncbi:histone-lysine N-methyltransferase set-1-like [Brienomyrus brachyistius]|uniref:histone-lysine N-methyltransferase set-1-like n=1 Tax=Brienomyrus brachyistius TaxID=42636 RepID=UPI0020B1C0AF|nr:histone-lysine N-methyltransferase set-1-like [Brienomyrus brachyistius]
MPRKRCMNPKDEAKFHVTKGTDKAGLDVKYINPIKGRGVFSTVSFEKGEFLLEYRGELISKQECESRQRLYHDSLRVFMFEFRFNGKLWCIDAAKEDGSLGRLVNDNHINPNATMKNLKVDGKPYLCLFTLKSISPGEEITYNYGDSDWPWRCTTATECNQNEAASHSGPGLVSSVEKTATECNQNEAASHSGPGLVSSVEKGIQVNY